MTEEQTQPKKRMGRPPKVKPESSTFLDEPHFVDVPVEPTISRLTFEQLKARGIPVKQAIFLNAVNSWLNTPEFAFYSPDPKDPVKKARLAYMWYVDGVGLVWEYNGKQGLVQYTKEIRFT